MHGSAVVTHLAPGGPRPQQKQHAAHADGLLAHLLGQQQAEAVAHQLRSDLGVGRWQQEHKNGVGHQRVTPVKLALQIGCLPLAWGQQLQQVGVELLDACWVLTLQNKRSVLSELQRVQ